MQPSEVLNNWGLRSDFSVKITCDGEGKGPCIRDARLGQVMEESKKGRILLARLAWLWSRMGKPNLYYQMFLLSSFQMKRSFQNLHWESSNDVTCVFKHARRGRRSFSFACYIYNIHNTAPTAVFSSLIQGARVLRFFSGHVRSQERKKSCPQNPYPDSCAQNEAPINDGAIRKTFARRGPGKLQTREQNT